MLHTFMKALWFSRKFITKIPYTVYSNCLLCRDVTMAEFLKNIRTPYLLTYSMVQSPSWEANWFAASQEIPRILRNPKVHYRTHKRPPPVPILGQPNPVHIPTFHLLEIHPNIILTSTPRSHQWSLSLRFPHQDPIRPPLLTHSRHMPSPSHCIPTVFNLFIPLIFYRISTSFKGLCIHCFVKT